MYAVRKEGDRWTCTCPDFEFHKTDATWRCEHILAVAPWQQNGEVTPQAHSNEGIEARANPDDPQRPSRKKRQNKDVPSPAQMLIKRSISPDGRINSVSVEFSMPVSDISTVAVKDKALTTLKIQKEIVGAFLKLNGQKPAQTSEGTKPDNTDGTDGKPVVARMIDIGSVNGKWGERLCINLQVNGRRCRLFGSAEQIATHIAAAGYEMEPGNVQPGLRLGLPCRITTKLSADGKYLNAEKVFPAAKSLPKRGSQ